MVNNTEFAGGKGTEESPYLIAKPKHLNNIRKHKNFKTYFKQISDIDLSVYSNNKGWEPIGHNSNEEGFFKGVYDGNGYEISNLYIEDTENVMLGLFSVIDTGLIVNVDINNSEIYGDALVGGITGINNGYISNCNVEGSIMGNKGIGGICGINNNIVSRSTFGGEIYGDKKIAGGIVGKNKGKIENAQCFGKVYGSEIIGGIAGGNCGEIIRSRVNNLEISGDKYLGGITGVNSKENGNNNINNFINIKEPKIVRCWSYCDIYGKKYLGGLGSYNTEFIKESYSLSKFFAKSYLGGAAAYNSGKIENCYSVSEISSGKYNIGGLVGYNKGDVKDSYYDKNISKMNDRGKGIPKTTEEMMLKNTFESTWQFVGQGENILKEIWVIKEGESYPYLIWHKENIPTPKVL